MSLVDKITLEIVETPCTEQHSRNEEKCGHAESAQMEHSHRCTRERLLHVIKAHEQQYESLEFVNPFYSTG
jgi:hypothetical protein